jgi:flagellar P-ring protein precursor FlgI
MRKRAIGGRAALLAALAAALLLCGSARAARIKDITQIDGIRPNQLYGFGLVVGLAGTGGGSDFTSEVARNMLERLRVGRGLTDIAADNQAAVIVTAELPAFAQKGSRIDVTVSAFDESASLRGGTLLLTPLTGADGRVYAVAQGALSVGGFSFGGAAASVQQAHPTVGRIPNGAIVEEEVPTHFLQDASFTLLVDYPDFATATRIATAVQATGQAQAAVLDAGRVRVDLPRSASRDEDMRLIAELQLLDVVPDTQAVVVINERTGTIVAGQNVSISMVAVSHGNLTVITQELPQVSQPAPLSGGTTEVVPRTGLHIIESPTKEGGLTVLNQGATVSDVARALNLLGASPRDIISIFQALKEAGALHAELRIM